MNKKLFLLIFALSNFTTPCLSVDYRNRSLEVLESLIPDVEHGVKKPIHISIRERDKLMVKEGELIGTRILTVPTGLVAGFLLPASMKSLGLSVAVICIAKRSFHTKTYTTEGQHKFDTDCTPLEVSITRDFFTALAVGNTAHNIDNLLK